jgi:hypothetical protein
VFDELALFVACLRLWASAVGEGNILCVCVCVCVVLHLFHAAVLCFCNVCSAQITPSLIFLDMVDAFLITRILEVNCSTARILDLAGARYSMLSFVARN